jgi:hypothetical protein
MRRDTEFGGEQFSALLTGRAAAVFTGSGARSSAVRHVRNDGSKRQGGRTSTERSLPWK